MEIEYSTEVKGKVYAYRIEGSEKQIIINAFQKHIKKIEGEIERIRNHPKNEGQATYSAKIDALFSETRKYKENIELLTP